MHSTVARLRDSVTCTLDKEWNRCELCHAEVMFGMDVGVRLYDTPLDSEGTGQAFAFRCIECDKAWHETKSWTRAAERVLLPYAIVNEKNPAMRDTARYLFDVALVAVQITRKYELCPQLLIYYGAADSTTTNGANGPPAEARSLASFSMSVPIAAATVTPVVQEAFSRYQVRGLFQHFRVFVVKVDRGVSEQALDDQLRMWIEQTLVTTFAPIDTPDTSAQQNLAENFFGAQRLGDVLNLSLTKHVYADPLNSDPSKVSWKVLIRAQYRETDLDLMYRGFQSAFLDADGDAQRLADRMMWSEVFDLQPPVGAEGEVTMPDGERVPVGHNTLRLRLARESWMTAFTSRRKLIEDAMTQFQKTAARSAAVMEQGKAWYVNTWEKTLRAAQGARGGGGAVDVYEYQVNAQKVDNFRISNTSDLLYIAADNGQQLLCYRPGVASSSGTGGRSKEQFEYIPCICSSDTAAIKKEMAVRNFVEASDARPSIVVPL